MKKKIICRWYMLEVKQPNGKWKDAGDVYVNDIKRYTQREMCFTNFAGHRVRMIECVSVRKRILAEKFFPMR